MKLRFFALRERLRESLWFIPTLAMLFAFLLSEVNPRLDDALDLASDSPFTFSGSTESARSLLSTISASMITFTGVVFSVTMLVLQLAAGQLSPRVMRTFLRDRGTQIVLGVFIGSFTYSLLILRKMKPAPEPGEAIQSVSIWFGVLLLFIAVFCFIYYIHHIAQSIRPTDVIRRVANETRLSIDRRFPAESTSSLVGSIPPAGPPTRVLRCEGMSGVVATIHLSRLAAMANTYACVFQVVSQPGDFLPRYGEAVRIWGDCPGIDESAVLAAIHLADERTMADDPAFGIRQLVDIAERALSPGINDPTTAVQVLDHLHDLLAFLSNREMPGFVVEACDGVPRVYLKQPTWDMFVGLAMDEIRQYGTGSIQVMRRQRFLLDHLLAIVEPGRMEALRRQMALLDEAIERGFPSLEDRKAARIPASQG